MANPVTASHRLDWATTNRIADLLTSAEAVRSTQAIRTISAGLRAGWIGGRIDGGEEHGGALPSALHGSEMRTHEIQLVLRVVLLSQNYLEISLNLARSQERIWAGLQGKPRPFVLPMCGPWLRCFRCRYLDKIQGRGRTSGIDPRVCSGDF
ncbi:MAG: hypothetical protein HC771_14760 [Synechococcales cyanobacterium CRU_2_2]|nr:hypothetical protein [Synechococcales cyanobacterium CRU_2_2]